MELEITYSSVKNYIMSTTKDTIDHNSDNEEVDDQTDSNENDTDKKKEVCHFVSVEHNVNASTDYLEKIVEKYDKKELILRPEFQRDFVWSEFHQQKLLQSIFDGTPIPPVILNKLKLEIKGVHKVIYRCIDGQQRLTTIIKFMKNQIPFKVKKSDSIKSRYIRKWYSNLPKDADKELDVLISDTDRLNVSQL